MLLAGNPSPSNLAPKQLTMPNFDTIGRGFGTGASTQDATFYLTVLEEYATGTVSQPYSIKLQD